MSNDRQAYVREAMKMLSEQKDKVRRLRHQATVILPREEETLKELEAQTASILNPRKYPTEQAYKEAMSEGHC